MNNCEKLIVFFDGTWNSADENLDSPSNVEKLYTLLSDKYKDNINYEKGVGTRINEKLVGGMFGEGVDLRIMNAYRFLKSRFHRYSEQNLFPKIYLFGFSRGAYTARVFANLLNFCGVPKAEVVEHIGWTNFTSRNTKKAEELKDDGSFFDVEVEMLGIWDTVKSSYYHDYGEKTLPPNVISAYHAMAIDEKRALFPVMRFDPDPRVTEVWFSGVHSDIGGGYKIQESQLSDIALQWMIEAGIKHGLEFVGNWKTCLFPDPLTDNIHDSMTGIFKAAGENIRFIDPSDQIHPSVFSRIKQCPEYLPKNIIA